MATLHISIPDQLEKDFHDAFAGEDEGEWMVRIVKEAIEAKRSISERKNTIRGILELRKETPIVTQEEIENARQWGRP